MLEVRFATIFVGGLVSNALVSASLVFAITLGLLLMQAKLKPYKETAHDVAHWSSANKMGTVGYSSQLVVLAVGLLCIILGDFTSEAVKIVLTLIAVVALMVPLALTAKIIVLTVLWPGAESCPNHTSYPCASYGLRQRSWGEICKTL